MELECSEIEKPALYDNTEAQLAEARADLDAVLAPLELAIVERLDSAEYTLFVLPSASLTCADALEEALRRGASSRYTLVDQERREARDGYPAPVPVATLAIRREAYLLEDLEDLSDGPTKGGVGALFAALLIAYLAVVLYRPYATFTWGW